MVELSNSEGLLYKKIQSRVLDEYVKYNLTKNKASDLNRDCREVSDSLSVQHKKT